MTQATLSYFVIFGTDKPGALDTRTRVRESHRTHLQAHGVDGLKVIQGGPTLDDQGQMNGSLLVVEAASRQQVEEFLSRDPYVQNGIFSEVTIRPWNWGLGKPASTA